MTAARLLLLTIALATASTAATAFVQSESGRSGRGWIQIKLRGSLVSGWRVESAVLLLHQRRGPALHRLDLSVGTDGPVVRLEARAEDGGWLSVLLPADLANGVLHRGLRIRWTGSGVLDALIPGMAPYLVVSGHPPLTR